MTKKLGTVMLLSMSAMLASTGCDDDDDDDDREVDAGVVEDAGSGATASARVIHLSPDAPAVDVTLDGPAVVPITDLEFTESTPFADVPAGTYDAVVELAGTDTVVLVVQDIELMADTAYTAVAFDTAANIQALLLVDELTGVPAGNVRVRAVHTAPALGQVDVYAVAAGALLPLYTDLDFGEVGQYLEVPAAATTLGVDVDDDGTPDATFAIPALPEGTVANVFAVNDAAGTPFLLAQLPDGQTARIDPQ